MIDVGQKLPSFSLDNQDGQTRRVEIRMRRDEPGPSAAPPRFVWIEASLTPVVDEDAPVSVVVCDHRGALVGFVVRQILDTVDVELSVRSRLDTGGHQGSAVINGKVTELIDMGRAVAGLDPAVFGDVPDMVGV